MVFESVFEGIKDSIVILERATFIICHANQSFLEEVGLSLEEVVGKTCYEITHHLDSPCQGPDHLCPISGIATVGMDGNFPVADHIHFNARGEKRFVEVTCYPITNRDGGSTHVIHISRDITYRKEIENRLTEKSAELLKLNVNLKKQVEEEAGRRLRHEELLIHQNRMASLGGMLGSLVHQWKQPLATISLLIEDLDDAYQAHEISESYIKDFLTQSLNQVQFMAESVDVFRDFFRPDRDRRKFRLVDVLRDVHRLIEPQLRSQRVNIIRSCECETSRENAAECDSCSLWIYGYANEFKHVILNLISNSRDAILEKREKEGFFEGEIRIRSRPIGERIQIEVKDNGPGISDIHRGHIFDRFFTTKSESKGTGIGLHMSREIIQEHMHGQFYIGEPDGSGALFYIEVPRYSEQSNPNPSL